ncbi:hypothetical protein GQR58_000268 [Nymphon striatum]|nr:hypothetical protein GQR58_000268 [Nymphon striatum]
MVVQMDGTRIKEVVGGVNQRGLRDYNERLLLSILQRYGGTAGSDLARMTGLSPQTVSIILRKLEADHLVQKGKPVKGRVGKPSVPMELCPGWGAGGWAKDRDLPVFVLNDATAACRAEHLYGRGKEFDDYAYFYIGSFIGGWYRAERQCLRRKPRQRRRAGRDAQYWPTRGEPSAD